MSKPRIAVIGCGAFGQNHIRVVSQSPDSELAVTVDTNPQRAGAHQCPGSTDWREVPARADAAIIATPTTTHAEIGCALLEAGLDVLVEKPIAATAKEAERLVAAARQNNRILQVGHLERFNPAVLALRKVLSLPLFFEIHRMNVFAPRSLDVDVVLDLMIHDVDLVLSMVGMMPEEVKAAGIRILSQKVDIANARLAFPGGCVANLTASRVSTERVRKLRLFQPHQYLSIDYTRQNGVAFTVNEDQQIGFQPLSSEKKEPLAAQFESFLDCLARRARPVVDGQDGAMALSVCLDILDNIEKHAAVVNESLKQYADRA
jgi:predicted dehydrogenase